MNESLSPADTLEENSVRRHIYGIAAESMDHKATIDEQIGDNFEFWNGCLSFSTMIPHGMLTSLSQFTDRGTRLICMVGMR